MANVLNPSLPPFGQDSELYTKLQIDPTSLRLSKQSSKGKQGKPAALPSQPHILLDDPLIKDHLLQEYCTKYLDNFAPHLWLVATQSHSHISSLTHQIVRGRNIVITENPKLHLLWYHDRVFIKPIPPYLLSHAFWTYYLLSPTSPIPQPERGQILQAARGYLRSWAYLIQHRSDFVLATTADPRLPLLPKNIAYGAFMRFISQCRDNISDADVSPRYRFGELRLSRINFWSQIMLKKLYYHKASGQYSAYFSRYFGIILFLFAFFSTALSAMQVALAAVATVSAPEGQFGESWNVVLLVSGWFAAVVLIFVASILVFLWLKFVVMVGREVRFAVKDLWRKRRS